MIDKSELNKTIDDFQKTGKSFAEFIATVFKDKLVEIYVGDSYEEIKFEQTSNKYPAVFCGKIIGAYRECLIIDCAYVDQKTKHLKFGNMLFLSERAIRGLNEVDGNGTLEEMFIRSKSTLQLIGK